MINRISDRLASAVVTELRWERIHLSVFLDVTFSPEADTAVPLQFYAVNEKQQAKAVFKAEKTKAGYCLKLNLTNAGNCRCLPNGVYSIIVCQQDRILAQAVIDPVYTAKLSDCSRNFLYGNNQKTYTVSFRVAEQANDLQFLMQVLCAEKVSTDYEGLLTMPDKVAIRQTIKKVGMPVLQTMYDTLHCAHKRNCKNSKPVVLFLHEQGSRLGNNHIAVLRRMKERRLDQQFKILVSSRPAGCKSQSMGSWIEVLRKLAMSDYIFVEDHIPLLDWVRLDDSTTVVQLWHAGAGFKSSGYSRWGQQSGPGPVGCHRQYKYGISGSKNIAHFFSEVWGINDENVLPTGMPRIDRFLDAAYRAATTEKLLEQYPLCKGKKVILFAPTFRGKDRPKAHYPYERIDFDKLYAQCGNDYVVLFKMHPWVKVPVPIRDEHRDKFLDVSDYRNINDLFYLTDLLITDYSSNIFEFSLMNKPMLFFAFDEIQYSFARGFHRDYKESVPGKICHSFDELLAAIAAEDFDFAKVEAYVEKHFDHIDSGASDRVIDWILLGQMPQELQDAIDAKNAEYAGLSGMDFSSLQQ